MQDGFEKDESEASTAVAARQGTEGRQRVLVAEAAGGGGGLTAWLAGEFETLRSATALAEIVSGARAARPDAIVLGVALLKDDGLTAAAEVSQAAPGVALVFVADSIDVQTLRAAFHAGGMAYVSRQNAEAELALAVRCALDGMAFVTPLLRDVLPDLRLGDLRRNGKTFANRLTPRQHEVLKMVALGKTIKEMSALLGISPKTVEFHKNALMNETGLRTTADLTRYAIANGIIAG